jgi:hypothetical protein
MGFLRKAGNYNLQEALAICDKKQLYRETVFLYGINLISSMMFLQCLNIL